MVYNPIHYPIGDIFDSYKEILCCNDGHRNVPAGLFPIPWFLSSVVKMNGRRYGRASLPRFK